MPESLKVAATYSPTMQRSPIGDAVCGRLCRLSPAPLCARPVPRPARLCGRLGTPVLDKVLITPNRSLNKDFLLSL